MSRFSSKPYKHITKAINMRMLSRTRFYFEWEIRLLNESGFYVSTSERAINKGQMRIYFKPYAKMSFKVYF